MKMKSVVAVLSLLMLFAALPLLAQDSGGRKKQLTVWASKVEVDETDFEDDFATDYDSDTSFGVSANMYFTPHFSAEVSVFSLRSQAQLLLDGGAPLDLGHADLTPVTLGAQFHVLGNSRFDPYIGAGAAYVIADDFHSADLESVGLGSIEIDNKASYYLNAGVAIEIVRGLGIALDARKIHFDTTSRSTVTGVEQDLDLSPLVISGGLRFRF